MVIQVAAETPNMVKMATQTPIHVQPLPQPQLQQTREIWEIIIPVTTTLMVTGLGILQRHP